MLPNMGIGSDILNELSILAYYELLYFPFTDYLLIDSYQFFIFYNIHNYDIMD